MINYCPHCGARVEQGANFCTACGSPLKEGKLAYQGTASNSVNPASKELSIASMVYAAISPLFAIFSMIPFLGFIFIALSITFISLAKSKRNAYVRLAGKDNGFSRAGKIVSTVAIPITCFFSIYCIAFTLAIIFTV